MRYALAAALASLFAATAAAKGAYYVTTYLQENPAPFNFATLKCAPLSELHARQYANYVEITESCPCKLHGKQWICFCEIAETDIGNNLGAFIGNQRTQCAEYGGMQTEKFLTPQLA